MLAGAGPPSALRYTRSMDFKQTAGCLSVALYWAGVFSTIIGSSLLPGLDEQASQCVRMVGSFGIAAGLAFQYASLPRISILDSRLITCAVVVFPVAYGALLFASSVAAVDVPAYVLGCTLFLAAAASSLLLCGIGGGFAMYRRRYGIITRRSRALWARFCQCSLAWRRSRCRSFAWLRSSRWRRRCSVQRTLFPRPRPCGIVGASASRFAPTAHCCSSCSCTA